MNPIYSFTQQETAKLLTIVDVADADFNSTSRGEMISLLDRAQTNELDSFEMEELKAAGFSLDGSRRERHLALTEMEFLIDNFIQDYFVPLAATISGNARISTADIETEMSSGDFPLALGEDDILDNLQEVMIEMSDVEELYTHLLGDEAETSPISRENIIVLKNMVRNPMGHPESRVDAAEFILKYLELNTSDHDPTVYLSILREDAIHGDGDVTNFSVTDMIDLRDAVVRTTEYTLNEAQIIFDTFGAELTYSTLRSLVDDVDALVASPGSNPDLERQLQTAGLTPEDAARILLAMVHTSDVATNSSTINSGNTETVNIELLRAVADNDGEDASVSHIDAILQRDINLFNITT